MKKFIVALALLLGLQAWTQDNIEVINIENPELQAFLADSTYFSNPDYSVSVVKKYCGEKAFKKGLDRPAGKVVTWTPTASPDEISEIRITVSEHKDYRDSITYFPGSTKVSTYTIMNNFPNRTYYYKVEEFHGNGQVAQVAQGVYRTVGQVRMMRVEGAHNVRDIGGWPTQFGVPIRYGRLYRSGNMDRVTNTGRHDFVDNMGVTAELDLRGESRLKSSPLGHNVSFKQITNDSYAGAMGNKKYRQAFVNDLNWIIARLREGKNIDWHCAVGCDRCGTLSFLIEGVLGVCEADLCRDYELSSFRGHKRYRSNPGFRRVIPYIRKFGPADDLAACFYNYWTQAGVSSEDLDYLRSVMLEQKKNNEVKKAITPHRIHRGQDLRPVPMPSHNVAPTMAVPVRKRK